ncbi:MAG: DUF3108 domain-containing protein [Deltaproteobacteria bacterium]|nr:MAG: DUF3108 domain-containing protein [Deltaproteobacteria bacterium]
MRRVVLVSLLMACASPAPSGPGKPPASPAAAVAADTRLRDGPPIATPGEHMQYRLSLQGIDLATYELGIGEVTEVDGKRAVVVQGHARTRGFAAFFATIDDHFTSWTDVSPRAAATPSRCSTTSTTRRRAPSPRRRRSRWPGTTTRSCSPCVAGRVHPARTSPPRCFAAASCGTPS